MKSMKSKTGFAIVHENSNLRNARIADFVFFLNPGDLMRGGGLVSNPPMAP